MTTVLAFCQAGTWRKLMSATIKAENDYLGSIEVICGPMFSGKTEELIRRLRRAMIARQRVIVYKPAIDNRFDLTAVVSHSQHRIQSVPVNGSFQLQAHLASLPHATVVGIDEAQFFDTELVSIVENAALRGLRVIVAGLDQDYLGRPFGPMPSLLAIADTVLKQTAVCLLCGLPATKTQRVFHGPKSANPAEDQQILVGATDSYEARCRGCYRGEVVQADDNTGFNLNEMLLSNSATNPIN